MKRELHLELAHNGKDIGWQALDAGKLFHGISPFAARKGGREAPAPQARRGPTIR